MAIKFACSYLNVELTWWHSHLTPNYAKFNPLGLPRNTSELIEFALLPTLVFYLIINYIKLRNLKLPLVLTLLLLVLNCITAYINQVELLGSIKYSLKIAAPIYFFCVLIVQYRRTGNNYESLLKKAVLFFCFFSLVALVFFDPSYNRGANRLPVYFSGLHTHNYILTVTFIVISYFLRKQLFTLLGFFFISFAFLGLGYGVRTIMVFYMFYIAAVLYLKDNVIKDIYAKIITYAPFLALGIYLFLRNFDFDRFSSGRLTMYAKKFDILQGYTIIEFLFGRGKGSDFVTTSQWWYDAKGSHNDYLTFFVENGFIFLLVFIILILSLLFLVKKNHIIYIVLVLGYLATSLISNGFAVRALASYWLFTFLAFIYIKHQNKELSFA